MPESRFCICTTIPAGTTPDRLRSVLDGLLDYTFGVPEPRNPEKGGNPIDLPPVKLGFKTPVGLGVQFELGGGKPEKEAR